MPDSLPMQALFRAFAEAASQAKGAG